MSKKKKRVIACLCLVACLSAIPIPQANAACAEIGNQNTSIAPLFEYISGAECKFNVSDARTYIESYPGNPTNSINTYVAGREIGEIWGFETVGIGIINEIICDINRAFRLIVDSVAAIIAIADKTVICNNRLLKLGKGLANGSFAIYHF